MAGLWGKNERHLIKETETKYSKISPAIHYLVLEFRYVEPEFIPIKFTKIYQGSFALYKRIPQIFPFY